MALLILFGFPTLPTLPTSSVLLIAMMRTIHTCVYSTLMCARSAVNRGLEGVWSCGGEGGVEMEVVNEVHGLG